MFHYPLALVNNIPAQTDPITEVERQVEIALDDLVAMGVLQTKNQMDINSLLNPEGECQVLTETSDEEIYQAVMDSIEGRGISRYLEEMMLMMISLSSLIQLVVRSSRQYRLLVHVLKTWMHPWL